MLLQVVIYHSLSHGRVSRSETNDHKGCPGSASAYRDPDIGICRLTEATPSPESECLSINVRVTYKPETLKLAALVTESQGLSHLIQVFIFLQPATLALEIFPSTTLHLLTPTV